MKPSLISADSRSPTDRSSAHYNMKVPFYFLLYHTVSFHRSIGLTHIIYPVKAIYVKVVRVVYHHR